MRSLKAIRINQFGTTENLVVEQTEIQAPSKNEVRINLYAAGVNPSDVYTSTGTYAIKPELPYTPGLDGAGIVEEVGDLVTNVKVGDRVFIASLPNGDTTGTIAEKIVCESRFVHSIPEHISFEEGAALGIPALTAYRAIVGRANVKAGQTVFIHGASGAVGLQAVQIAKALGAKVIGTASRESGKQLVKEAGADIVLDHITEQTIHTVLEQTDGKGPNVIIEFLANENLQTDLQMIAKQGVIVVVGNRGEININPRLIMQKECDVRGMVLFNITAGEHQQLIQNVAKLLDNQQLKPVIGYSYPLEEASIAFNAVINGEHNGKVVVRTQ
ncbi:NADPH:quinone reductase [Solibacillus merdavium]|uniref:NADPH:quinone reductase n=1 Tax=Solibacillus merdavium TaxID=2762218 RepID=UPI00296EBF28|nr:NADPH:quinone reductase [Solibacillus merdavium]